MRQVRVYVDAVLAVGRVVPLPPFAADHVVRVLRLTDGAPLTCFNGDGQDYTGIVRLQGKGAAVHVGSAMRAATESPLELVLAQAICRGEKMDLVVQKATELGVARIVPLETERTEVRLDAERAQRRLAHWRGVAVSACEQCGRAVLPMIDPPLALDGVPALAADAGLALLLDPEGDRLEALAGDIVPARLLFVVGPEGGFAPRELAALEASGLRRLRLGPRVLRTETAGLAALATANALWGDCR